MGEEERIGQIKSIRTSGARQLGGADGRRGGHGAQAGDAGAHQAAASNSRLAARGAHRGRAGSHLDQGWRE